MVGSGEVTQSNGSVDTTKNTGKIARIDGTINGATTKEWDQRFLYDEVGRLKIAAEYQQGTGSTPTLQTKYTYDRHGNRFQSGSADNFGVGFTAVTGSEIVAASNRFITTGSTPTTYDEAGNIKQDTKFRNYKYDYDANNRQTGVKLANDTSVQSSIYDSGGQRVRTTAGSATRTMIYDIFGQDVADYAGSTGGTLERENIYRGGQLLATQAFNLTSTNVARASNGATSSASSAYSGWAASGAINGDRKGLNGGQNGGWVSAQAGFPAWLQVDFNGSKTIDEVDVFTLQDNWISPSEPTEAMTFSLYGLSGYEVQYWNGSSWVNVSGGSVSGNNKVWVKLTFQAITTSKIRVLTNASADNWSRLAELEAWTTTTSTAGSINYVLADAQGSVRAVMSNTGTSSAITARHDYLPFGEEISSGTGQRTGGQGYGAGDTNRQKYALTERDDSSGLDHTWWRKYDSSSGRWTSPDPYRGSMTIANPQSFNRYTYTQNDPVNFVDPTGLAFVKVCVWWATHDVTNPTNPIQTGRPYLVCSDVWIPDGPVGGRQSGGTRHHPQEIRRLPLRQKPTPAQQRKLDAYNKCRDEEIRRFNAQLKGDTHQYTQDLLSINPYAVVTLVYGVATISLTTMLGTATYLGAEVKLAELRFVGRLGRNVRQSAARETECAKLLR